MDPASEQTSVSLAAAPVTQLAQRMPETDADPWALVDSGRELPAYEQQRMRKIEQLMSARGTKPYRQEQRRCPQLRDECAEPATTGESVAGVRSCGSVTSSALGSRHHQS